MAGLKLRDKQRMGLGGGVGKDNVGGRKRGDQIKNTPVVLSTPGVFNTTLNYLALFINFSGEI